MIEKVLSLILDICFLPFRLAILLLEIVSSPIRLPILWVVKYLLSKSSIQKGFHSSMLGRIYTLAFKGLILALASVAAIYTIQWIFSLSNISSVAIAFYSGLPTWMVKGFYLSEIPLISLLPKFAINLFHFNLIYFDVSGVSNFILAQITKSDYALNLILAILAVFTELTFVAMLVSSTVVDTVISFSETLKQMSIGSKMKDIANDIDSLDKSKKDRRYLQEKLNSIADAIRN